MEIKYKNCVNELARRSLGIGGCKSVSKNGFTLIEVITAVGLLAIIIAFSSVIFNFGIDAYRISAANAEIMQKARALTEQLNSDLQGLRKDAPLAIWFQQEANNRYDQLMFFADGDFTSMQLYDSSGEPVDINDIDRGGDYISGNLARIHYGHTEDANGIDSSTLDKQKRSIGRRCHILTNDPNLDPWPNESDFGNSIGEQTTYSPRYLKNESYEHDTMPLNEWKKID
ncbi:MAG: prepilin-type N-terminal cleavage/methylation domain-containing protein, partial [Phycisphaerae bacterium]